MSIDYKKLAEALLAFSDKEGRGAWSLLERQTGVHNIGRIARGQIKPTPQTWERLHKGAPDVIPRPPWLKFNDEREAWSQSQWEYGAGIPISGEEARDYFSLQKIPVFNAGVGPDNHWSDGGFPVGESDDFVFYPSKSCDDNTFGVRAHGDSMSPTLHDGDVAIVVPSAPLEQGKLCFASWSYYEDGKRLIRRYYKYGDTVVLHPDNPAAGKEITLDDSNSHGVNLYRVKAIQRDDP